MFPQEKSINMSSALCRLQVTFGAKERKEGKKQSKWGRACFFFSFFFLFLILSEQPTLHVVMRWKTIKGQVRFQFLILSYSAWYKNINLGVFLREYFRWQCSLRKQFLSKQYTWWTRITSSAFWIFCDPMNLLDVFKCLKRFLRHEWNSFLGRAHDSVSEVILPHWNFWK